MAEVEQQKQRAFRKVTYLGEDLDRLGEQCRGRAAEAALGARRWLQTQPWGLPTFPVARKEAGPPEKPQVVKVHLWDVTISREWWAPQGQDLQQVEIVSLARGPPAPCTHNL
ncbi:PREDICTED: 40S ribosomal protein S15 [Myotis davidii]|uniref:40S ribosomal protein S15 n=1 Tax=Myotis davidii TaxID=225400 RepID=L5M3J7_MYODS|nr:PREDICTED: 40S ribosomal protein S15 [Myotis davidii]ELK33224.1 40S ribosomal protein S15 [Myotis davidii]